MRTQLRIFSECESRENKMVGQQHHSSSFILFYGGVLQPAVNTHTHTHTHQHLLICVDNNFKFFSCEGSHTYNMALIIVSMLPNSN